MSQTWNRVTGSPDHQCDPVYYPVLAYLRAIFVLYVLLFSVNNRKSTAFTTTGRLIKSSQQHHRFRNNVQYSNFVLPIMVRHGTGSPGQKVTRFHVWYVIHVNIALDFTRAYITAYTHDLHVCVTRVYMTCIYARVKGRFRISSASNCGTMRGHGYLWANGYLLPP
jgi:hypothetical protein